MWIGKTPKTLDSIYCPQCRETNADKVTEANRRGPGTREKVSSRRINLEGNTHVQAMEL
jgi:ribosomal protein L44E